MDIDVLNRGIIYRIKSAWKATKDFLFIRLRLNVLIVIILLALAAVAGYYLKPADEPTGLVALSDALAQKSCPSCPICSTQVIMEECDEPETVNVIYYQCANGLIVNDTENCKVKPNITTDAYGYANGFTLSIDGVTIVEENKTQGLYRITWINYTVINDGPNDIVPLLEARVYDKWSSKVAVQYPQKIIQTDDVLVKDEYIRSSAVSNIIVKNLPKTFRLALKNKMDEEGEAILAVTTVLDSDE